MENKLNESEEVNCKKCEEKYGPNYLYYVSMSHFSKDKTDEKTAICKGCLKKIPFKVIFNN